jgi:[ribosomal protein S5]-alanine N-acetyltransferase
VSIRIPTLHTERLVLVPPSSACAQLYDAFYTDAEASRLYGGPLTSGAARARLASDLEAWTLQGFGVWAIQRRDQGDLVGTCGFWQGKGWPRELTWWLLPAARGAGLAHQASLAAVAHAYEGLGWPFVETYMNDGNKPARMLADRLGGISTGRRCFPDGIERDVFRIPAPGHHE